MTGDATMRRAAMLAVALAAPALAAVPAGAQTPGARGGTTVLMPSLPSGGPCDATVPMRDAAAVASERRRSMATLRELVVLEASGAPEERQARVVLRRPAGWLGMSTVDVSDLRLTRAGRVVRYCAYPVVVSVEPDSPADRGGLLSGDTIVAYAGRDLLKAGEIALDELFVPGETVRVTVRRDGRTVVKPVVVGQRPMSALFRSVPLGVPGEGQVRVFSSPDGQTIVSERIETTMRPRVRPGTAPVAMAPNAPAPPMGPGDVTMPAPAAPMALPTVPLVIGFGGPTVVVGAQVVAADDDLREALGADARGVAVLKVLPGTPAAAAGLRAGDVIVRAGGQSVLTPMALHRAVMRGAEARTLALRVDRRGKEKDVTLKW